MLEQFTRFPVTRKTYPQFFSKIAIDPEITFRGFPCWMWTANLAKGYGRIKIQRRSWSAHRLVHEWFVAMIPKGMHIDHLCRRPRCVNPIHLEIVPPRINCLRGEGVAARNAAKTHCVNGHPFAGANLVVQNAQGHRACLTCRRAIMKRHDLKRRPPKGIPTHCKNGHELTPDNIYHRNGNTHSRRCRTCRRLGMERFHQNHPKEVPRFQH